ncbi:unnamed protein product [Rotaria sordida]|uniref:Cullin family profile domain-containing protein n=1 Tax=Rotaria sordida TaxID=392033 RepID=A0A815CKX3_9BILA|nr:unnamed protein product [Rotaria sordida]
MLAKRLINQLSTSIDYEESMISKLKQACGLVYTNKLQQMFQDLKITCDNFIKFYNQQHNGRKLTWLYQRSNGDLQILYTKSNYILHVSTYQMAILLVFNKFPKWTIEKMQDETQLKVDVFFPIICDLLKSKLIICPEIKDDDNTKEVFNEADIKVNYHIQIADDFTSVN